MLLRGVRGVGTNVEGLQAFVRQALLRRLGQAPRAARTQVATIDDADQLLALLDAAVSAPTLADVSHALKLTGATES